MDAVGIAERTRPPATAEANGRAPEPDHFTDPAMTRAARMERATRRRVAPEAWRLELRDLYHYTADYPYDPDHEYAWDWTTDPDYGTDSVRLFRFDADGVMDVPDKRATGIQLAGFDTTSDRLGSRVEYETAVHYRTADGVVRRVHPDLMVLPRADMLGMATGRDRALRLDRGQPPPDLALEILSFGGMQRDLEDKLRLYARLGIREYLVYDLGGKRRRGSPRELLLFRLENGAYRRAEPEPKEADTEPEEYWSDVFGTYIRMMPDPREAFSDKPAELRPPPRFQWWDPEQGPLARPRNGCGSRAGTGCAGTGPGHAGTEPGHSGTGPGHSGTGPSHSGTGPSHAGTDEYGRRHDAQPSVRQAGPDRHGQDRGCLATGRSAHGCRRPHPENTGNID